jgi:hypothetical protein
MSYRSMRINIRFHRLNSNSFRFMFHRCCSCFVPVARHPIVAGRFQPCVAFVETPPLAADQPHVASSLTTTPRDPGQTLLYFLRAVDIVSYILCFLRLHSNSQIVKHQLHLLYGPIAALTLSATMARAEDVGNGGMYHSNILSDIASSLFYSRVAISTSLLA